MAVFTYPDSGSNFIFPNVGGGGGGTITSVNGDTGPAVVLDADDVGAANQTLSNLTDPTSINQDLILQSTKTVRLPNDTYLLGRNTTNSANINLIRADGSNSVEVGSDDFTPMFLKGNPVTINSNNGASEISVRTTNMILDEGANLRLNYDSGATGLTLGMPTSGSSYNLNFPGAQGASDTSLINNGSGTLSWAIRANSTLSNLTSPTAINQDLIFNKSTPIVQTQDATGTNSETLTLTTGTSDTNPTGALTVTTGASAASTSGNVTVKSGNTQAASGSTNITTGNSTTSTSGDINIFTGEGVSAVGSINIFSQQPPINIAGSPVSIFTGSGTGTGVSGAISVESGASAANTGAMTVRSGVSSTGSSGNVTVASGNTSGDNASGTLSLVTGDSELGTNSGSGAMTISTGTGASDGSSGTITINSGGAGESGSISILTGSGVTLSGDINVQTSSSSDAAGVSGKLNFTTGTADAAPSGEIYMQTGNVGDNISGQISIFTGTGDATGDVYISTGAAADGNSGHILLETGTASGNRGNIDAINANLFLPPQHAADPTPATGGVYYNTSTNKLKFYNGTTWETVTSA